MLASKIPAELNQTSERESGNDNRSLVAAQLGLIIDLHVRLHCSASLIVVVRYLSHTPQEHVSKPNPNPNPTQEDYTIGAASHFDISNIKYLKCSHVTFKFSLVCQIFKIQNT